VLRDEKYLQVPWLSANKGEALSMEMLWGVAGCLVTAPTLSGLGVLAMGIREAPWKF
jgi:hypothetical protein